MPNRKMMNSFQMKNSLAGTLGDEKAEELVAYIDERTGRKYGEERALVKVTLQEIVKRLDRIENHIDTLQQAQVSLIRWMIGVGFTVVGLTVTLVKYTETLSAKTTEALAGSKINEYGAND